MSAFKNIVNWSHRVRMRFGNFKLQKELQSLKREHRFLNFKEAKKIGILFYAQNDHQLKEIDNYIKNLQKSSKDLTILAYWDKKDSPENPLKKMGYDYFTSKDVNWILIPNHTLAKEFTYSNFDILITIGTEHCFPLQYVSAMAKATMRVGRYSEESKNYFDLMIHEKPQSNNLKNYFQNLDHYLQIINP